MCLPSLTTEFHPQIPYGGRRELITENYVTSFTHLPQHIYPSLPPLPVQITVILNKNKENGWGHSSVVLLPHMCRAPVLDLILDNILKRVCLSLVN